MFSWMRMLEFCLKFHGSLFLRVQLTISQHWFRWWLGAWSAPSHYLNQLEQLERLRPEIPPTTTWLPILVIHIRSQVKTRQSQSYKLKKNAKNSKFAILQQTLHTKHLLKLLGKMYEYEMDPTRTVGATERTRDAGRMDGQSETNILPTTSLCVGYNNDG